MDPGVGLLHVVQYVAHLSRPHRRMVQKRHKLFERALKVDVVFPQRVVGIADQVLAVHWFSRGARWKGISKVASTSPGTPSRTPAPNSHFARPSCALPSRRSST